MSSARSTSCRPRSARPRPGPPRTSSARRPPGATRPATRASAACAPSARRAPPPASATGSDMNDVQNSAAFRRQLRYLLADRASPEAAALFQLLLKYVHRRVYNVSRVCGNALTDTQQEEIASEVLLQLMQGALARFRGESMAELYAFARTIADRSAWRAIRRTERERNLLQGAGADIVEGWNAQV